MAREVEARGGRAEMVSTVAAVVAAWVAVVEQMEGLYSQARVVEGMAAAAKALVDEGLVAEEVVSEAGAWEAATEAAVGAYGDFAAKGSATTAVCRCSRTDPAHGSYPVTVGPLVADRLLSPSLRR